VGGLLLAGLSLVGLVGSCSSRVTEPDMHIQTESPAWPTGDFQDIGLSSLPSEYGVASSEQIQQATDWALDQSYKLTPAKQGETRHDLRARIQSQDLTGDRERESETVYYNGADVVVIAFEGTAGFHARKAPAIQAAAAKLREQGLRVDGSQGSLSSMVSDALLNREGRDPGWSGLSRGPLEGLVRTPEWSERVQWLSFPSEEIEILSSFEAFQNPKVCDIVTESYSSYVGETPGIEGALKALREVLAQAGQQGKNPKFVLLSHSSGGRSLVKFLEKAKAITDGQGEPLIFSSAITIDPVREAHEAFLEGSGELINKGTEHNLNRLRRSINLSEKEVWPPLVRHRPQPESLYAPSNADKFLNFYQKQDTEGLKIRPLVGIQGSPVEGAVNQEIFDVGSGGHGEIAVHPKVREAFLQEIASLLTP
jgi:hypothetical protein